ncbi:AraC family transcriptional regulator [Pseudomonas turukhanskensis]|uniref:Transcriptional regulator n=1 Tax=Pseudomonas turukhanskensis TaxID=1806536 RepID=A0A9W6K8Z0_9PSED|nr:AraC family transcriptional regulator [Pseudomonas turukhanskensis]GLK91117.1 transcriptional regulator [Pseudomonas turukhanskensis]
MATSLQPIDRLATLHFIALVDAFVAESGHSTARLLQGTQLVADDLRAGDKLISVEQECMILRNAQRLTQAEHLGLELGQRCRLAAYGVFGFTLLSSRDLRAALELFFEYPLPLGTGFELSLVQEQRTGWLNVDALFDIEDELRWLAIEFSLTALQSVMADLLYQPLPLNAINIGFAVAPQAAPYQRYFNCPVTFDLSRPTSLSFDAAWLDHPLPCANAAAHSEMRAHCSVLKSHLESPRDFLANVRSAICLGFDTSPSLSNVATSMACSSKTLQRHLRAAGTSFNELLCEARYQRAQELLLREMPVARIAESLGFSEAAAFRRAFQRWSGCTPSQYRSHAKH